ncbi:iron-regulated ABC transporter permease protein SufD [Rhodopseudomonas faecalis]|uniref:Iron-regulated ABC transporter permease protein SufD n=1 Tax=Rhodopseudomonas faecalis TaxID=99655 RepID=A0A318TV48_9BRAD|nr:Fe-S cluster assembly protein SufD [Rhodopseudomonas faecalis]PYF03559.1 iron-regulated ABC transporter permease protein SufD [Rhodopseudomonas faecalis]
MTVVATKPDGQAANAFEAARSRLPGAAAVTEQRQAAFDRYTSQGLPHRRVEDWKYTDLRVLMREVLPLAAAPDHAHLARAADALQLHAIDGVRRLVLVDGVFVADLSDLAELEPGLSIRPLREVLAAGEALDDRWPAPDTADAMVAFNAALMTDGVVIEVGADITLQRPLQIVHVAAATEPASIVTRSLLRVGQNATATLVESFVAADGSTRYQLHDALHVTIAEGGRLDHLRLNEDAIDAFHIASLFASLHGQARYNACALTTGGGVSRYQGFVRFNGEGAEVTANGVNLLNGTQHADTTLFLDHAVPHCVSREVFRAVLDGRAHSVFQGRIMVRPHAQKTDAKMMTRALLLSDEAEADNKPELEIFADDVTCGHGATTGALDDTLLFYLRARGLPEKEAQALLIQAFIGEAIESIVDDQLRALAIAVGERWLEARA